MTKNIKIFVDGPNCISCWACIAITDWKIFGFDQASRSYAIKQPESPEEIKMSMEAAEACPVAVIHINEVQESQVQVPANDNNADMEKAA